MSQSTGINVYAVTDGLIWIVILRKSEVTVVVNFNDYKLGYNPWSVITNKLFIYISSRLHVTQVNIFDFNDYKLGNNPWSVLINSTYMDHSIDPGIREYTRIMVRMNVMVTYASCMNI